MVTRLSSAEWFDPALIRFKISPHHDLGGIKDGDWDLDRRHPIGQSAKYRSIVARYTQGAAWEETELFTDVYRRRFERGENIRGERTLDGLLTQYYTKVDALFAAMRRDGFSLHRPNGKQNSLIRLLRGRDGELFIGNQGNHRLAMAHVLKLDKIAGEVICRHRLTI